MGGCYRVAVFGIGPSELLVVAVLALLLFSPRELPKILRSVTQLWGSLRRTADEFRDAIMQEEAMQDLKDAVDGTKAQLRDAEGAARRELMKARMEARRAENKLVKVARERERIEREAAAAQIAEGGGGEAATAAVGDGATPGGAQASAAPSADADRIAPAGTVAAGSSVEPPKSVDPRHAAAGNDTEGDAPANQGAA